MILIPMESMMRKSNEETLLRRNLMFPENFVEDIAELRRKTGAQSDSELLRRAFRVYEQIMKHDGTLFVRDKDGKEREFVGL